MERHIENGVRSDKHPLFLSTRSSVYLMLFLATTLQCSGRFVINMNIVCMVVPERHHINRSALEENYTTMNLRNDTLQSSCEQSSSSNTDFGFKGEFHWSRAQVGYIMAAFFYSYIPMQMPAGWLADKFGIRHVLGTGILIGGILNLLTPLAARLHYGLLIALRIVMGIAMGGMIPCIHSCIGKWVPQNERSTFAGLIFSGPNIGIILSSILAGLLCKFSWTIVFYLLGCVTILCYIGFLYVVYSSPEEHPRISIEEKAYIKGTRKARGDYSIKPEKVPWRSILTSRSVMGMCVNQFAFLWIYHTSIVGVPLYLQDVMYFNVKANGVLSSLPLAIAIVGNIILGGLCDVIHSKIITSKRILRKTSETVLALSVITLFVVVSYMNCNQKTGAVIILCLLRLGMCFRIGGMVFAPSDIAPRMAGLVYGVSNLVGNFSGFLSAIAIGNLTGNGTQAEWQRLFLLASGIVAVGWLCHILLVGSNEEPWARVETTVDEVEQDQELEMKVNLSIDDRNENQGM